MTERASSRHVRSADLLPPPPMGKPLAFGGAAAIAGAVVWGLLIIYGNLESGWLAWGIGGLVGFAVVKGGGHGTMLSACAGVLALLSILSGKNISYRVEVADAVEAVNTERNQTNHELMGQEATEWVALGDSPTAEQVLAFATKHSYEVDLVDADEFARIRGPVLRRFAESRPTLEQWREQTHDDITANFSFVDSLVEYFHPLDILFVLLGIGTAFGLVTRATTEMTVAARQQILAEREAEREAAAAEEPAP